MAPPPPFVSIGESNDICVKHKGGISFRFSVRMYSELRSQYIYLHYRNRPNIITFIELLISENKRLFEIWVITKTNIAFVCGIFFEILYEIFVACECVWAFFTRIITLYIHDYLRYKHGMLSLSTWSFFPFGCIV